MPICTEYGELKPIVYLGAIRSNSLLIVKYRTPPNPTKQGWWLPAPEIQYGQDPAEQAAKLVSSLGLSLHRQVFAGLESFIANNAWHLLFKYRCEVSGEVKHDNVADCNWITLDNLPPATEFAHGNWELDLCRYFLSF